MKITITDHSGEVLDKLADACENALNNCGRTAVGYAKMLCPVDNGTLRNSIDYRLGENGSEVNIGSPLEYAVYVEMGTGQYYEGGRKTPWSYQDERNNWHWTRGQEAQPYLKPAIADNQQVFRKIIEDELKNG